MDNRAATLQEGEESDEVGSPFLPHAVVLAHEQSAVHIIPGSRVQDSMA